MKFSSLLFFATMALAAPTSDASAPSVELETRQQTVVGTVVQAANSLKSATDTNVASIKNAVATIQGSVSAEVEATVRANLKAIADAIDASAGQILAATTGAVGGIIGAATDLSQQQINQLIQAIKTTIDAIDKVRAIIEVQASDLTPALAVLVKTELDLVRKAINPFVTPLIIFSRAVQTFSARVGVTVKGLRGVTDTLFNNVKNLLDSLGLPFDLLF